MKLFLGLFVILFSTSLMAIENPEGVVYCHGKTVVEFRLINPDASGTAPDVELVVNGKTKQYMTSYSWYGSNQTTPKNFKFAILGEKQFDPLLVFDKYLLDAKNINTSNVINTPQKKKDLKKFKSFFIGGTGGNRTRVRKSST